MRGRRVIDANLSGAYRVARRATSKMIRARWGRMIFISSVVALTGSPGQTNYAASKAGLIGFARSLARELGGRGVTVNVVSPGFVTTDMTAALPEARQAEILEQVPLKRMATPEEVAAVGHLSGVRTGRLHHGRGHTRRRRPRNGSLMTSPENGWPRPVGRPPPPTALPVRRRGHRDRALNLGAGALAPDGRRSLLRWAFSR